MNKAQIEQIRKIFFDDHVYQFDNPQTKWVAMVKYDTREQAVKAYTYLKSQNVKIKPQSWNRQDTELYFEYQSPEQTKLILDTDGCRHYLMYNREIGFILVDKDFRFLEKIQKLVFENSRLVDFDFEATEKENLFYIKITKENYYNMFVDFMQFIISGVYSEKLVEIARAIYSQTKINFITGGA